MLYLAFFILGISLGFFCSLIVVDSRPVMRLRLIKSNTEDDLPGHDYKLKLEFEKDLDTMSKRHWGIVKIETVAKDTDAIIGNN